MLTITMALSKSVHGDGIYIIRIFITLSHIMLLRTLSLYAIRSILYGWIVTCLMDDSMLEKL